MVVEIKQPKKSIKYPTKEVSRNLRKSVNPCSAHARPPAGGLTALDMRTHLVVIYTVQTQIFFVCNPELVS